MALKMDKWKWSNLKNRKNKKLKQKSPKQHPRKLQNNTKWSNMHKTGVPKQRISKKYIFEEIMPESFPNVVKEMFRGPRGSANPTRIDFFKKPCWYIYTIIEALKTKDKVLKATRGNYTSQTGNNLNDYSSHQKQWRSGENKSFRVLIQRHCPPVSSKHFLRGWR